jgi:hypothetical protein
MPRMWKCALLALPALAVVIVAGCTRPAGQEPSAGDTPTAEAGAGRDGDHAHKPGQHGGTIVAIGQDNYHAEAVFAEGGLVRLYLLGKDEARIEEVELQDLTAYARAAGQTKAVEFTLKPAPRRDDSKGKTSVFEGTLPPQLRDRAVEVTVPTIRIGGGRFRFAFASPAPPEHGMPRPAASAKARQLYLTPKGKYTEADIKANGAQTARQKYGDQMSAHDAHPRPGDRICPISQTKANPKFTWVVGGKTYQFCCTPCIDEFVKLAREKPDEIGEPGDYVQK